MGNTSKMKTLKDRVTALEEAVGGHTAIIKFNSQDEYELAIAVARTLGDSLETFCNKVVYNNINAFLEQQRQQQEAAQAAQKEQVETSEPSAE